MKKCFISCVIIVLCARYVISQSCSLDPDGQATNAEVLILGAGIAGISAARTLEVNGVTDFLVIEAGDRIGGRIREYGDTNIEIGANWIQGLDPTDPMRHPIWREWTECDADGPSGAVTPGYNHIFDPDGNPYNITDENGAYLTSEYNFEHAYETVEELGEGLEEDISLSRAFRMGGWNPQSPLDMFVEWSHIDLCSAIKAENMSLLHYLLLATYTDFVDPLGEGEGIDYLVTDEKGYSFVVDCMARNFKDDRVRLNSLITRVHTAEDCVCVTVEGGDLYCGDFAVLTFSIGALQASNRGENSSVQFYPPLPKWKQDAIDNITLVQYGKIFLQFDTPFWEESDDQQSLGYVSNERGDYLYFVLDENLPNTILFSVTEDLAIKVASQSENETASEIMTVLRRIFGEDIPDPHTTIVSKWTVDPLFYCAFTVPSPGVPLDIFDVLLTPVNYRLYFAGESLNITHRGFTNSGYGNGAYVADQVLSLEAGAVKCEGDYSVQHNTCS